MKTHMLSFTVKTMTLLALLVASFSLFFTATASAADPGCYARTGSATSTEYTPMNCPSEGYQRGVDQLKECYVFAASSQGVSTTGTKIDCATFDAGSNPNGRVIEEVTSDPIDATCNEQELTRDNCGIIDLLVNGINVLSALAGMAIVFSIMFAGYQYMTARDNSGQIQQARSRIIWAIAALLIFIFMYALLNFLIPGGVIPG